MYEIDQPIAVERRLIQTNAAVTQPSIHTMCAPFSVPPCLGRASACKLIGNAMGDAATALRQ